MGQQADHHWNIQQSHLQADNVVVRKWGALRDEPDLRNHVDLVTMLDIADLDRGTIVAGGFDCPE